MDTCNAEVLLQTPWRRHQNKIERIFPRIHWHGKPKCWTDKTMLQSLWTMSSEPWEAKPIQVLRQI